jgi:hypothetical protein
MEFDRIRSYPGLTVEEVEEGDADDGAREQIRTRFRAFLICRRREAVAWAVHAGEGASAISTRLDSSQGPADYFAPLVGSFGRSLVERARTSAHDASTRSAR